MTRQDEQSQFEHELRKFRHVWLVADWGAGQDGFLSAALERLTSSHIGLNDIFHLRCEEAANLHALEALFPQQFGLPVQIFSNLLARIPGAVLLFDAVHPALCEGIEFEGLQRLVAAISEYCQQVSLVITSRLAPPDNTFTTIVLRSLEMPEVRTYLLHHPDSSPEIRDADIVEKLHERSDGLPMHLDRLIRAMKVASPCAVL
jgi:hypothetical protein